MPGMPYKIKSIVTRKLEGVNHFHYYLCHQLKGGGMEIFMSLNKKAQLSNVYHNLPADTEPLQEVPEMLWRALEELCTEEQADAILMCTSELQSCEQIAATGGADPERIRQIMQEVGHMGLVEAGYSEDKKEILYRRADAIPGLVENLVIMTGNQKVAEWLDKYADNLLTQYMDMLPPGRGGMRAIPVRESIDSTSKVCTYDELTPWIENSEYFTVTDCSCRKGAKLMGHGCEHSFHETCIQVSKTAESYMLTGRGRQITKAEVYDILKRCEEEGLVHQVNVTEMGDSCFICNCCGCNCIILRNCNLMNLADKSASNFVASVDPDKCVGCGACVEDCNMNALSLGNCFAKEPPKYDIPNPDETEWTQEYWDKDYLVRTMVNEQGTSPCKTFCPAHISVQGYIKKAGEGKYGQALKIIKRENPFPAICGRICPHNCEAECTRNVVDDALAIDDIKKFIADKELNRDLRYIPKIKEKLNHRAAVIGAGPAGLSCAYYLASYGFSVTVFEKETALGGMLKFGIPSFRLEKNVIDAEIDVLKELGVRFVTGVEVGKDTTLAQLREEGYEAFYIAIGAQNGRKLGLEGEDGQGVQYGVDFLRKVNLGEITELQGTAVVIGGGNVAIDVARSAVRLSKKDVAMYCLEQDEEMPTVSEEKEEAIEEGVLINNGWGPKRILTKDGKVVGVEFKKCVSVFDTEGRFAPSYSENEVITVACDHVLVSVGQAMDWGGLLENSKLQLTARNTLVVDGNSLQAGEPDVFGGGDAVTGPKIAIDAIATGKKGAISIQRYLLGLHLTMRREREYMPLDKANLDTAGFDRMPRQRAKKTNVAAAKATLKDLRNTLTDEQVREEAKRCLGCGVTVVNPRKCIGCGVCTTRCEFDAIKLKRFHDISVATNQEEYGQFCQEYAINKMTKIAAKKAAEAHE